MGFRDIVPFKKRGFDISREEDNPFALFRKEMDSVFDRFFRGFELDTIESRQGVFSPKVDVIETETDIRVTAELPGIDEKDIDVSLVKDALTIKGEKKEEREDKGRDYYRIERSFGSFSRTIPLPIEIEPDKVSAEFKKGILTVTLPKSQKAVKETKKINVKTE